MAKSIAVAVADAVTQTLNDGTFAESFKAAREYRRRYEPDELRNLRVFVVPRPFTYTRAARGSISDRDALVDVAIAEQLPNHPDAQRQRADALMALAEEVIGHMANKDRAVLDVDATPAKAAWRTPEEDPVLSSDRYERGEFFFIIPLRYASIG